MLSLASRETGKELYVMLLNGLCDVLVYCLFVGDGVGGPNPWDSPISSDGSGVDGGSEGCSI